MRRPFDFSPTERALLDVIRRNPGISRAALTAHTAVTQQTVHRMLDGLEQRGLIRFAGSVVQGRGKPSPGVELIAEAIFSVGISVNTDAILISVANLACREVSTVRVDTDPADRRQSLRDLRAALDIQLAQAGVPWSRVVGAALSISGFKSGPSGHYVTPVPLSDWSNRDIGADLAGIVDVPVWHENNATSGATGEAMVGAGLDHDTFAYLSLNYGFGCGLVIRGTTLSGGFGNAGEIGRIFRRDEIERRPALGELLKRLAADGIPLATITELCARYDPTWPTIERWLDEVTPQLQLTIRALTGTLDPTAIVFGGEAPVDLRARLISRCPGPEVDRYGTPMPGPVLINSTLETDPAAFGAALLPIKATIML